MIAASWEKTVPYVIIRKHEAYLRIPVDPARIFNYAPSYFKRLALPSGFLTIGINGS
jgi:hypothetical protein